MPRRRRAAKLQTVETGSRQLQLRSVGSSPRNVRSPERFIRAIMELERVRGLRVHPESATIH
jgi:hypothetical protein